MIVDAVLAVEDVDVELPAADVEANVARPEPGMLQPPELLPDDKIGWELSTSDCTTRMLPLPNLSALKYEQTFIKYF